MSPDSVEARLGRMETAVARLEQRTDDLATDVRTLAPLVVAVAEVKLTVAQVQTEAHNTLDAVRELRKEIENRREQDRRDAKATRRVLIGVGVAALLSPFGTIAAAVVVGSAG